ncbi:flagellar export protein FliJ [Paenalcaligenes hominis]|uniref:flagellar export protein FliJ n=1 Tax=Paenalcaligenes hominis TaxID=643674 RepID=UPI003525BDE1
MPNASMHTLIQLAENEVEQHTDHLQRLNSERQQASQQLSTLHQYRLDYSDRLLQASQSGVTMSNYHNFYRFIGTLDQAITQQNSLLEHLESKITQQQQQWLAAKQRLNAYQTLQDRRDQAQAEHRARVERRENDELSAAMHYRLRQFN